MMTGEQAIIGVDVMYVPWAKQRLPDRYGVIVSRPDANDKVQVRLGRNTYEVALQELQLAPRPLVDDLALIAAMKNEMKFVDDASLQLPPSDFKEAAWRKLVRIQYFETAYQNTDQDTIVYAPEFVIVVRNILAGKRPVKLRFLTDFEGEEK
jgi:hypothetical protein